MDKNKKIIQYRRRLPVNLGGIFFGIIFLYIVYGLFTFFTKDRIRFYEVVEGSMVADSQHRGLILREERVEKSLEKGYIDFYIREGKRTAAGGRIYSIDSTGTLKDLIAKNTAEVSQLSDSNIAEIKRGLSQFATNFSNSNFQAAYDKKYSLDSSVYEYSNLNTMVNIDKLTSDNGIQLVTGTSPYSGEVSFALDDLSEKTESQLVKEDFAPEGHPSYYVVNGENKEKDAPIDKVVTSETWSIYFELSKEDDKQYGDRNALTVKFTDNDLVAVAEYSTLITDSGLLLGKLTFDKYMVQFLQDRYVDFEIETQAAAGLKIPVSAVVEKDFYTIPLEYKTSGGNTAQDGFFRQGENGESPQFVPAEILFSDGTLCYISMTEGELEAGDVLVKPDSDETYQIGPTGRLQGAFNINKGYAAFRAIEVLSSNKEYYIIKRGTGYGLNVYDHILLKPRNTKDGDFLYQ